MSWGCNDTEMQEYVLNLSISLRTGEETNLDFFSSGERTRKSSNGNNSCRQLIENPMERGAGCGDSPRQRKAKEEEQYCLVMQYEMVV